MECLTIYVGHFCNFLCFAVICFFLLGQKIETYWRDCDLFIYGDLWLWKPWNKCLCGIPCNPLKLLLFIFQKLGVTSFCILSIYLCPSLHHLWFWTFLLHFPWLHFLQAAEPHVAVCSGKSLVHPSHCPPCGLFQFCWFLIEMESPKRRTVVKVWVNHKLVQSVIIFLSFHSSQQCLFH